MDQTRPAADQRESQTLQPHPRPATEWAYAKPNTSETERTTAYQTWLHHYNHHRPQTGIGGNIPSTRVHNVTGKYIWSSSFSHRSTPGMSGAVR